MWGLEMNLKLEALGEFDYGASRKTKHLRPSQKPWHSAMSRGPRENVVSHVQFLQTLVHVGPRAYKVINIVIYM